MNNFFQINVLLHRAHRQTMADTKYLLKYEKLQIEEKKEI